ncbi:MAG: YfhO family protein [Bacteroidales bacterium]
MKRLFRKNSDSKYILLLLLISLLSFSDLLFHPMKWDMIDYFLPMRRLIGETLRSGNLPLWNPYIMLGQPIYADPQSGAWYPIAWILGSIFGYNIFTISFEYVLHVFLAGLGVYLLLKTLNFERKIAFTMGVAYMLSGFFVGNGQHLSWIIAGTWLPFVISSYLKLYLKSNIENSLKFSFFVALIFSGGYPAVGFILFYILLISSIFLIIRRLRNREKKEVRKHIKFISISMAIILPILAIFFVSNIEILPHVTRASSLTKESALTGHFHPKGLLSLIAPLSVHIPNTWDVFGTDLSMINAYFGLIVLIFAIVALLKIKDKKVYYLFVLALLFILTAMGVYTGIRGFLFDYIPLMNYFRFPSIFRLFFILFMVIISAYGLQYFKEKNSNKLLIILSSAIALAITGTIVFFRSYTYLNLLDTAKNGIFKYNENIFLEQAFSFNALFQLTILLLLILVLIFIKNRKLGFNLTIFIIIAELFISTKLTSPYTVYDEFMSAAESKNYLNSFEKKFSLPNGEAIALQTEIMKKQTPFWRNLTMYNHQVSNSGFTPFVLGEHRELNDNFTDFRDSIIQNSVVYIPEKVYPNSLFKNSYEKGEISSKDAFFNVSDIFENSASVEFQILKFTPNKIEIVYNASSDAYLILQQHNYPHWRAKIDDKTVPLEQANIFFMGIKLPSNSHKVVFEFKPKLAKTAFYISAFSWILIVLLLLFLRLKKAKMLN